MDRRFPHKEEALKILHESGCTKDVIRHCITVSKLAVEIAKAIRERGVNVNVELVEVGALLHDVGRSRTHSIRHAIVGAELAKSYGLSNSIVSIIERHMGGGFTAEEAKKLGLPSKSYLPEALEEKIVCYADKLVKGVKVIPFERALEEFNRKLGDDHPATLRVKALHEEILSLMRRSYEVA